MNNLIDLKSGLEWHSEKKKLTYDDAVVYVNNFEDDWRLPTIDELKTLAGSEFDPELPSDDNSGYWVSSSINSGRRGIWYIYFGYSSVACNYDGFSCFIRCVRDYNE